MSKSRATELAAFSRANRSDPIRMRLRFIHGLDGDKAVGADHRRIVHTFQIGHGSPILDFGSRTLGRIAIPAISYLQIDSSLGENKTAANIHLHHRKHPTFKKEIRTQR